MIPKVGEIVRINEDFIRKFLNANISSDEYDDWKKYLLDNRGKDFTISNVSISFSLGFDVAYKSNHKGMVSLTREGICETWKDDIDIPFFSYDRISVKANSHLFCCCENPKIKRVFVSKSLQYDFCEICRKEKR